MWDMFGPIDSLIDVDYIRSAIRVLLVGFGRVGRRFAELAMRHGVEWFRIIEPDIASARNFASGFSVFDEGQPKIRCAQRLFSSQRDGISFDAAAQELSEDDLGVFPEWLEECTHVGLFLDDFQVASVLAQRAYPVRPCLFAAVFQNGASGEAAWSNPGQTPCLRCTARLDRVQGARGGQTALADVDLVVNLALRQFLGLCLVPERRLGYERYARYVDPCWCLTVIGNTPDSFVERRQIDTLFENRLVEVVDGQGNGPSCPTCSGYHP